MIKAVFAGSFDPFTLGHKDIVIRASKTFDKVIVAVAKQTGKNSRSLVARKQIIEASIGGLTNVEIAEFDGLLTNFLKENNVKILVRGVRNSTDFDYEKSLMGVYRSLFADIEFVLLPSMPEVNHVSSTVVRELVKLSAPIDGYVDTKAKELIKKLYQG